MLGMVCRPYGSKWGWSSDAAVWPNSEGHWDLATCWKGHPLGDNYKGCWTGRTWCTQFCSSGFCDVTVSCGGPGCGGEVPTAHNRC